MNIKIVPGILEKDFEEIKKKISLVSPYVDTIQIDFCDGKLVPNTNYSDPEPFREIIKDKTFELHAMVSEPTEIVDGWIETGFKRIVAHIEGLMEPMEFLNKLREKNVVVGLGIDVDTKVTILENYLDFLDYVLIMTVRAGFSGQTFNFQMLDKVKWLRGKRPNLDIEIDGGVNDVTAKSAIQAGSNMLVSTSYIFGGDVKTQISKLKSIT